ncbi:MAG TPA: hypothetical protein PLK04_12215 [Bacillota bacterium]|nr:hypothetical protein [Bacillota bacterium]
MAVERLLSLTATGSSWSILDSDQSHTFFIKTAAPLMGRNVTVGVKVAF